MGLAVREDLLKTGLTPRSIGTRLSSGQLEEVHPGVYGIGGVQDSWERRVLAAYMWAQPEGFVSHRSACALYGLDGAPRDVVELSTDGTKARPGIVCHRLHPTDRPRLRSVGHVRVPFVERCLLDLAGVLAPVRVGLSLDDALRKRLTTLERMWDELEAVGGRGRRGSRLLRELLSMRDDRDGTLQSQLEAAALRVLRDKRLPPATTQFVVAEAGANPPRLDFAYPPYRVGVEPDGFRWHHTLDHLRRDDARDRRLKLLGWIVLHYSYDDFRFDRENVIDEVRTVLASRGAQLFQL